MSPVTHLIDTSAAARILTNKSVRERWSEHLAEGVIGLCDITEMEILFSAQSLADRLAKEELLAELFNWTPVPDDVYRRALAVQRMLTERGEHRSSQAPWIFWLPLLLSCPDSRCFITTPTSRPLPGPPSSPQCGRPRPARSDRQLLGLPVRSARTACPHTRFTARRPSAPQRGVPAGPWAVHSTHGLHTSDEGEPATGTSGAVRFRARCPLPRSARSRLTDPTGSNDPTGPLGPFAPPAELLPCSPGFSPVSGTPHHLLSVC